MYLTRSEYDRGVNTFSPEGRLFQVEYAIEAIKLGSTAIGLQTKKGSVLAVEKRLTSPLLEPSSVEKIAEIDVHVGAAMSGLVADARTLVDHARVEAQNHRFTYDEPIGVEALTQGEYSFLQIVVNGGIEYIFLQCGLMGRGGMGRSILLVGGVGDCDFYLGISYGLMLLLVAVFNYGQCDGVICQLQREDGDGDEVVGHVWGDLLVE